MRVCPPGERVRGGEPRAGDRTERVRVRPGLRALERRERLGGSVGGPGGVGAALDILS